MNLAENSLQSFQQIRSTHLPIYRTDAGENLLVYTPGLLWKTTQEELLALEANLQFGQLEPNAVAIVQRAKEVLKIHKSFRQSSFQPTNITLYLNQKCNFNCKYCFALETPNQKQELSLKACLAGLDLVGRNCHHLDVPMTLAIHGGGEPLLAFHKIQHILAYAQAMVEIDGLRLYKYIATNGVMPIEKARWITRHFDRIGISCDGPPEIQDKQRPQATLSNSNAIIERTAQIIRDYGTTLDVRVTITPATVEQQPLIARYICENLAPQEIHVEPVYLGKRTGIQDCISPSQVDAFIHSFMEAEEIAGQYGAACKMSGARLNEVHSSYCHLLQQVLNLVPGDEATACFKLVNDEEVTTREFSLGRYQKSNNIFVIDQANFHRLLSGMRTPEQCQGCFIQYQCSHACPNNCLLTHEYHDQSLCSILKGLVFRQIINASEKLKSGEMIHL